VTSVFKSNAPQTNIYIALLAICVKFNVLLQSSTPLFNNLDGILYKSLLQFLQSLVGKQSILFSLLAVLLVIVQAISFNRIVNNLRLHKQPNFLTGMVYVLLTSFFEEWQLFSAPLVVNTIMILVWARLSALNNSIRPKAEIFNLGLLIGLCSFIYFPSFTFLLLIIAGITLSRPFRLQEWIIGFLGVITPIYFLVSYYYLVGKTDSYKFPGFRLSYPRLMGNEAYFVAILFIVLMLALGIYFVNRNMRRLLIQTRKHWQLMFFYLFVALLVPFVNATTSFAYFVLLAVPLSAIIATTYFYVQKKLVAALFFWAAIGIIVAVNYF
jgi:magnesium-transporting ATPase (P-type)